MNSSRLQFYFAVLLLVGITWAVFWPVTRFEFVNYDDDRYIAKNPYLLDGLSWKGIRWAFTADLTTPSPYVDYWQPVTLLSRMLDIELFGLNPRGHHTMNLILHTFNVILLFELLWSWTGALGRSACVAAFFALHPLQVEPVVWITARKDLLCFFFGLLTLKAYGEKSPLAIPFFLMSLLSKPALMTLPLLLLGIDLWPLARKMALRKKWPYFLFSGIFTGIPLIGQMKALTVVPFSNLLAAIPVRYGNYLGKVFYPAHLAVYPPFISMQFSWIESVGFLLLLLAISYGILRGAATQPSLAVGWFWFLIALVPTWGLDRFEDRFMYIPLMGLAIVFVWGISDFLAKFRIQRVLTPVLAGVFLLGITPLTFAQVETWRNSVTLFEHSLRVNPNNFLAHNQLCSAWLDYGDVEKALGYCREGLKENPSSKEIWYNSALALTREGKWDEAIPYYRKALQLNPEYGEAQASLGVALSLQGNWEEAEQHLAEAVRLKPDSAESHFILAKVLLRRGEKEAAIQHFKEALRLKPDSPGLRRQLDELLKEPLPNGTSVA